MAVMISIQPKWVEEIASGRKLWEVRKGRPKSEVPFRCYIYETKESKKRWRFDRFNTFYAGKSHYSEMGKVIGEFVCDKIELIKNYGSCFYVDNDTAKTNKIARESCLDYYDMRKYLGSKDGYAWHISDLKIYEKPKEIWEFKKPCITPEMPYCPCCQFGSVILSEDEEEYAMYHGGRYETCEWHCRNYLKRPPQSWGYVEEER